MWRRRSDSGDWCVWTKSFLWYFHDQWRGDCLLTLLHFAVPRPCSLAAKWFQYRLSIHHPLGFNWNLLEGAHFLPENQSWQLSLQMNEGSIISKRQESTPLENEHVLWKGTISKGRKSTQGQIIAKKPRKFCWGPKFRELLDPRKFSPYTQRIFWLLEYDWHRTKPNSIISKKHFEAISSVKSILAQHHNQNTTKYAPILPTKKRNIFPSFLGFVVTHQAWWRLPAFPRWISMFSSLRCEERLGGLEKLETETSERVCFFFF